ncbi:ENTH/VHS family protein, putative isoform 1 [Hibiscus syriacus]|uniref:Ribosome production factor 2 homolog n=1 Tax=Hibiscus syriacus TaxID=106335 RepID=A0A6A3CPK4_HIBSY|nr:ENTH/VHS family protein, putative isoform 1 [Hibiscus syriacus]
MIKIKTPRSGRVKRALEKRAPKLVETGKKILILQGTKTSGTLNEVLSEIYHLKKGGAVSMVHTQKRPNNLILGRMYDHYVYDLVEVGVENFKSIESFTYDKKMALQVGSKPFIAFVGEGFENIDELKHLKEVLLDLLRGEVYLTHCALRLKKSGSVVPRMELVEIINVSSDAIEGTIGKIYIPDQKVGDVALPNKAKGVKRERREAKKKEANERASKKQKNRSECMV